MIDMKRVLAIAGIVILAGLYITTLVTAIARGPFMPVFMASLAATIALPITIHLFLMINNARNGRSVMDEPYNYKQKKEAEDGDKDNNI